MPSVSVSVKSKVKESDNEVRLSGYASWSSNDSRIDESIAYSLPKNVYKATERLAWERESKE